MRLRFAPSPTGSLHVGGARTALYNWILAKKNGGVLVLRIEDTDEARSTVESERSLLEDLKWLGIDWGEGPDRGGPYAPYRQSERLESYREAAKRLVASGAAYESWASDDEIGAARAEAEKAGVPYRFDRDRHNVDAAEHERRKAAGERPSVRLAVPWEEIVIPDLVRGDVHFPAGMFSDFILLRSSGFPTYNFACAVDDAAMKITHVVRGEEHLSNTGKQLLVHKALGQTLPTFAHLPLILDHDRSKLSKRSGGATVGELRTRGFLPEGVLNMLALQGWHPPGEEERLTRDDLVQLFELPRVRKAGGIYDLEKMSALNAHWLHEKARAHPDELAKSVAPFLQELGGPALAARAPDAVRLFSEGAHLLADIAKETHQVDREPLLQALPAEIDPATAVRIMDAVIRILNPGQTMEAGALKSALHEAGKETGTKGRDLYRPVRLALTGSDHGPDLARIAEWLGKSRVIARLENARSTWKNGNSGNPGHKNPGHPGNPGHHAGAGNSGKKEGAMRRIAVLMGGDSQERDVSRVTGTAVARALADRGHEVTLLDTERGRLSLAQSETPKIGAAPPTGTEIERAGVAAVERLAGSLGDVDVVFLALHGGWGEDGTIQGLFEMAGIPYTGSGVLGSALAMDKDRAKRVVRDAGEPTPDWALIEVHESEPTNEEFARARSEAGGGPVIVKPNAEGSTVGLSLVSPNDDLRKAFREASQFGRQILIEKYIPGRELTISILGDDVLPIVEIIPDGGIYTYQAKYTKGQSRYEVPANLPPALTSAIQKSALRAFRVLGLEGFARLDYRLAPDESFWFLEANTIPGMTPLSLVPMAAKAAGISFEQLVERIVDLGAKRVLRRTRRPGTTSTARAGVSD
ncbi:MAG TPA: glutamate--tRNA ligase [bacterium]|nr:glutamate--tRNA ligase [bacterium]